MHINKSILTLMLCCFMQIASFSQIRYEDLDKYSKAISEIQNRAQPVIRGGHKITFPVENFVVFFTTKLASHAYYEERDNLETLLTSEDIDFSKTSEIYYDRYGSSAEFINVKFEKEYLVEYRQNDKNNIMRSYDLQFYFDNKNAEDRKQLFRHLAELIFLYKINKSPLGKSKLTAELNAWKKAINSDEYTQYTEFIKAYPGSVFLKEAKNCIAKLSLTSKPVTDYFKEYFSKSNRSQKYKNLWGNWKLGDKISNYAGKIKDIKQEYLDESNSIKSKSYRHTYSNAGPFFEYYSYDVEIYDDSKAIKNNTIELNRKTELIPKLVGINKNREVVYLSFTVKSKNDLPMSDLREYLGVDEDKRSSSDNNEFYQWFFDDCTIIYVAKDFDIMTMVGRAKENMSDYVTVHFHNKYKATPSSAYKLNKGGKVYEISPELWEKMIQNRY